MIQPALPPACYTQQYWFDLEREKLFNRYWLLAGLTQQLRADNSFITRTLAGIPVLIQNCGGTLRAFRNACPHRACPIQIEPCGNRKLLCPYHGWSFGHDGKLRGIPGEKFYGLSGADKACMDLHPYALETVGNFVFVNLAEKPLPIAEQFPKDLLYLLTVVSTHFAPEVSCTTFTGNYNWKLNFENISEDEISHIPVVHKYTLAPALGTREDGSFAVPPEEGSLIFSPGSPLADIHFLEPKPTNPSNGGSVATRDISTIRRIPLHYASRWFSALLENSLDRGSFFACPVFPNVNFGSIHGEHFFLQQFVPLAPDRTEYHSWVFTARLKEGTSSIPHLLWGIHHAEKRVVDEDVVVFEQVQKTLSSASTVGIFGDNEYCLANFGRWYMQHLNEGECHE
ncbi:MAG: Rieske 2Fe-2S domain-containing protein [Azoarcus sp.]|jgi:phenylpropionate dioxygenase-like ring-hydroxylating dioxygenase large terminal subunit|nr:Rieske 2Fe-2S domain-containing protein [Azoarcus sp.]